MRRFKLVGPPAPVVALESRLVPALVAPAAAPIPLTVSLGPASQFAPAAGWSALPTAPAMRTAVYLAGRPAPAAVVTSRVFASPDAGLYAYVYQVTTAAAPDPALWGLSFHLRQPPVAVGALWGPVAGFAPPGPLDAPGVFLTPGPRPALVVTVPPGPGRSVELVSYATDPPTLGYSQQLVSPVGWGVSAAPYAPLPVVYAP